MPLPLIPMALSAAGAGSAGAGIAGAAGAAGGALGGLGNILGPIVQAVGQLRPSIRTKNFSLGFEDPRRREILDRLVNMLDRPTVVEKPAPRGVRVINVGGTESAVSPIGIGGLNFGQQFPPLSSFMRPQ